VTQPGAVAAGLKLLLRGKKPSELLLCEAGVCFVYCREVAADTFDPQVLESVELPEQTPQLVRLSPEATQARVDLQVDRKNLASRHGGRNCSGNNWVRDSRGDAVLDRGSCLIWRGVRQVQDGSLKASSAQLDAFFHPRHRQPLCP
jgi:hypothetical protein